MPRVTKQDLLDENAQLKKENERLKAQLGIRDRSRSRHRSASSRRCNLEQTCKFASNQDQTKFNALNHVLAWERDAVIDEQRQTMAKMRMHMHHLRDGEGSIGMVLLAIQKKDAAFIVDEFFEEQCKNSTETVADTIRKLERLTSTSQDILRWGHSFWEGRLDRRPFPNRSHS
jgi:cell division protein FtsB